MGISHKVAEVEALLNAGQNLVAAREEFFNSFCTFWHHGNDDEIWQQRLTTRLVRAGREMLYQLEELHMRGWDYGFVAGMEHERKVKVEK